MSEAKYTKGPWNWMSTGGPLDPPQLEGNIEDADYNPVLVCDGCNPSCRADRNEPCPSVPSKADQDLIAAAPDLYEALDTQCEYCIGKEATDSPCADCIVGKALRKARGEE